MPYVYSPNTNEAAMAGVGGALSAFTDTTLDLNRQEIFNRRQQLFEREEQRQVKFSADQAKVAEEGLKQQLQMLFESVIPGSGMQQDALVAQAMDQRLGSLREVGAGMSPEGRALLYQEERQRIVQAIMQQRVGMATSEITKSMMLDFGEADVPGMEMLQQKLGDLGILAQTEPMAAMQGLESVRTQASQLRRDALDRVSSVDGMTQAIANLPPGEMQSQGWAVLADLKSGKFKRSSDAWAAFRKITDGPTESEIRLKALQAAQDDPRIRDVENETSLQDVFNEYLLMLGGQPPPQGGGLSATGVSGFAGATAVPSGGAPEKTATPAKDVRDAGKPPKPLTPAQVKDVAQAIIESAGPPAQAVAQLGLDYTTFSEEDQEKIRKAARALAKKRNVRARRSEKPALDRPLSSGGK